MSCLLCTRMKSLLLVFLAGSIGLVAGDCGEVYEHGISEEGKKVVVEVHNKYRKRIANGEVPNQPRGIDLLRLSYDEKLEKGASAVSKTCNFKHLVLDDSRFTNVGQNIFLKYNGHKDCSQNWTLAVYSWFSEHTFFDYEKAFLLKTGHYTQVVWADTYKVGCDFICFYDKDDKNWPYYSMYTCNYGPGGNCQLQSPYEIGIGGCEDLC